MTFNVPGTQTPAAGALFNYEGRKYRLNSWLCPVEPRQPSTDVIGQLLDEIEAEELAKNPNAQRIKLRWCLPEEATYVSGSGVGGCVARLEDIEVVGMVAWSDADLAEAAASALRRGKYGHLACTLER